MFEGEVNNKGKPHGFGILISELFIFQGMFKDGTLFGTGREINGKEVDHTIWSLMEYKEGIPKGMVQINW